MTIAELIYAKNRFGPPGVALLSHDPRIGKYADTKLIPREKYLNYIKETGLAESG